MNPVGTQTIERSLRSSRISIMVLFITFQFPSCTLGFIKHFYEIWITSMRRIAFRYILPLEDSTKKNFAVCDCCPTMNQNRLIHIQVMDCEPRKSSAAARAIAMITWGHGFFKRGNSEYIIKHFLKQPC